jgi:hypothetical protein
MFGIFLSRYNGMNFNTWCYEGSKVIATISPTDLSAQFHSYRSRNPDGIYSILPLPGELLPYELPFGRPDEET